MENFDKNLECDSEEINFDKCQIFVNKTIETEINDTGRLIIAKVNLYNVLSEKAIAVGVLVFEGNKLKAFKARKVYSGHSNCCRVKQLCAGEFYFVLPDWDICSSKNFKVRVIAHYTDINRCLTVY